MEMTDRLSTLTSAQQSQVVVRVFQKLSMAYGNQLVAKWQGLNMQDVYTDWAEALAGCSLAAINHGITQAKNGQHPPSQGEFLAHCRAYKPNDCVLKLELKLSPEQVEMNRKRIAEIAEMLSRKKQA